MTETLADKLKRLCAAQTDEDEFFDCISDNIDTIIAALRKQTAIQTALAALYEWYDRDGSVGGASEVFEKYRDCIEAAEAPDVPSSSRPASVADDLVELLRRVRSGSVDAEVEIIEMFNERRKELTIARSGQRGGDEDWQQTMSEIRDFLQDVSVGAPVTDNSRDHATEFVALLDVNFASFPGCKRGTRMNKLNQAIWSIPMPDRIKRLPISREGFPVPWFVAWVDAQPDFRVASQEKLIQAVNRKLCWVCGQVLGIHKAFLIGPMCACNRVISEPPSHYECADYAVRACPFLTKPRMRRNETDMPDNKIAPAGIAIMRNPGVTCLWITKTYRPFRATGGMLFELGEPERVEWFCEGRTATRAEVQHSIDTGLPTLRAAAEQEGPEAVDELEQYIIRAQPLLPEK